MPRKITKLVYKYDELDDWAKEKARNWYESCSAGDTWWDDTYEDAAMAGIKIAGFDLSRRTIKGKFTQSAKDVALNIKENHGATRETHKTACAYLADLAILESKVTEDEDQDNALDDLADQFKLAILEDYRIMLQHEYDYTTSQEYVEEAIRANEYEFTQSGKFA